LKPGGVKRQDYIDRLTGKKIDVKPHEPKAKRPVCTNKTTRPVKAKPAVETKPTKDIRLSSPDSSQEAYSRLVLYDRKRKTRF
jgi:hypothetical protein